MQVMNVQARCLNIPIKFPFTETPRTEGMLLVHVETDEGIGGAGISRDAERFAVRELIHQEIRPFLLGKDPVWSKNSNTPRPRRLRFHHRPLLRLHSAAL